MLRLMFAYHDCPIDYWMMGLLINITCSVISMLMLTYYPTTNCNTWGRSSSWTLLSAIFWLQLVLSRINSRYQSENSCFQLLNISACPYTMYQLEMVVSVLVLIMAIIQWSVGTIIHGQTHTIKPEYFSAAARFTCQQLPLKAANSRDSISTTWFLPNVRSMFWQIPGFWWQITRYWG